MSIALTFDLGDPPNISRWRRQHPFFSPQVVGCNMIIFGAIIKWYNMMHLCLTFFAFFFVQCTAFSTSTLTTNMVIPFLGRIRHRTGLRVSEKDEQSNDTPLFPQLPPIGESSYGTIPSEDLSSNQQQPVAFVSDKFELQYTCKVCETRNSHRVSRIAYRNGVVITDCKGCESKHLIADHLGWTDYDGGFEGDTNTIEDYFVENGLEENVNRVSQDVFELEKLLNIHTNSGSIVGDGGNPAME